MYEAVKALEKAQEALDRERRPYLHRAVLVLDDARKVVGKVSQLDVLRALEPKYADIGAPVGVSRGGFSARFMKSLIEQFDLFDGTIGELCKKTTGKKVKHFMHTPTEGEYVEITASLGEAIHQLVMGHHQSLLVTQGDEIVGILRLTDVFKHVSLIMKTTCETK